MSTLTTNETITTEQPSRLQAYVALTKMRISVMVLLTFAVAAVLAAHAMPEPTVVEAAIGDLPSLTAGKMICALIGMLAIAGSGNAMNMYLERYSDFLMPRTAKRPLPAQLLSAGEVAMFGAVSFGVGVAFLYAAVNWQTAVCGVANWILYVFIYTPLKPKTHWNTEIGAVAGAMPIIMGSLAATETVGLISWAFFGVLFLWQFPHFMAIAWMYREDYRRGGLKMLTVTEPTGNAAGVKAVVTGAMLIAVSLLPVLTFRTVYHGIAFAIVALVLGGVYFKAALAFRHSRTEAIARKLLRSSLLYLPLYMLALILASLT